jgi:hypothetical protein
VHQSIAASSRPAERTTPQSAQDLWSIGVLPILAAGALSGFLGLAWDISWHIDRGRDTFFTPPHDFLYAGLVTVLVAAVYGLCRDRRDTPFHLHAGPYRLHPGLLIVGAAGLLILAFAPLDDLWHRLFGRDVTLWGPMHLVGLLGMAAGRFGGLVCAWIERSLTQDERRRRLFDDLAMYFAVMLLAGMDVVVAEYEFVVPQFPMIFHPILLAGLTVFPLVLIARLRPRPYAATAVTIAFTLLRFLLAGWLAGVSHFDLAGISRPIIPLLIPTGIAVDLLAARGASGWISGLVAGAVTLAANLVTIDAATPGAAGIRLFWSIGMFAQAAVPALVASAFVGAGGSAAAAALGAPMESRRRGGSPRAMVWSGLAWPRQSMPARATWASVFIAIVSAATLAAAAAAVRAAALPPPVPPVIRGQIRIAHGPAAGPSLVTVRIDPPSAPHGRELLLSIFQPGGVINRQVLDPISPGVYRSKYVFPAAGVYGFWMRFGAGQAGFVSAGAIGVINAPGAVDDVITRFRSGLRRVPAYVQPLGYTIFGLIAVLTLTGMGTVLSWMR